MTRPWAWAVSRGNTIFLVATVAGLALGGVLHLAGAGTGGHVVWALTTGAGIAACMWWIVARARQHQLGVDVIALLALVGALVVAEELAGAVISVMLATGRTLEARAAHRARRELRALLERAPRSARLHRDGTLATVALDELRPGDLVLVGSGEIVPVDGTVVSAAAVLDESALTGESLPVERAEGDPVRSGVVNAGAPFDMRATTTAEESSYAGIVRLVRDAQAAGSPSVRLADRYAGWFLAVSLAGAGAAWAVSGQLTRAVAVLVVATPCPLVLAVPVAIVSGLSLSARRGVVVKGGAALEQLARCRTLLFDKTGTLTVGRPALAEVVPAGGLPADDVLRYAASLDQVSPHVLAAAIVKAARDRHLALDLPVAVEDVAGRGVRGIVDGHPVAVGKAAWLALDTGAPWVRAARRRAELDGALTVFVEVDGVAAGALVLDDPVRADAARTIRALRRGGIDRVVMVTGDRAEVADTVGAVIGVDEVLAERTPAEKVEAVTVEHRRAPTIMVGDGINDAPALAAADVGVAMGARGATASSEAADVVLTVDRLERLGEAVVIARHARSVALQSVLLGIGLSVVAMAVAGVGLLAPTWGAIAQEGIDVAAIVNALRALRPRARPGRLDAQDAEIARRFSAEHTAIKADIERLRTVADALATEEPSLVVADIRAVSRMLVDEVLPHEEAEDAILYPALARALGGVDPTGTMSRAHVEISHQIRRLGRLLDDIDPSGPDDADVAELRRLLYGLHAILRLHTAQEDEGFLSLADEVPAEHIP
ncbi:MAG TPA: heavy metal translocating P-type ATPase [Acidimicrobiales bacterium]|nr:heavy metal translocating P-type ATPase [Acidimicrobiales bacterium]